MFYLITGSVSRLSILFRIPPTNLFVQVVQELPDVKMVYAEFIMNLNISELHLKIDIGSQRLNLNMIGSMFLPSW